MPRIRCAIYDRVSTEMQVKEGLSLEAQEAALTDYALSHGYEIVGYYADEGLTARKKMKNRKELLRLLKDVEADKIDLILDQAGPVVPQHQGLSQHPGHTGSPQLQLEDHLRRI